MHATTGVPSVRGGLVRAAPGDSDPLMPNIAEVEPRMTSNGAVRTRGRRDDLRSILEHLAYNLRWSWNPATVELFRILGPDPWQRSHNPVSVLRGVDSNVLAEHAEALLDRS